MAFEAQFVHGSPLMVDHTPAAAVDAGDVVVIGDKPYVAHLDIPADTPGAVAAGGGVYRMTASGDHAPGEKVYWNDTTKKITTATGSHPHFGYVVPSSDPAADGDAVEVEHDPDGTATGV